MNCNCLIHPFQNDPGTSQSQRLMDSLLEGAPKIDARTTADLLNYFVQMSRHINYYDLELNASDWQPFFGKSIPFVLTSIIKFPLKNTIENLQLCETIFRSKPSPQGIQLLAFSIYQRYIKSINNWHKTLYKSNLPIEGMLDNLIRSKLQGPVKEFIIYNNTAVINYGVREINFRQIADNPVWSLDDETISAYQKDFLSSSASSYDRLVELYSDLSSLHTVFSSAIADISAIAEGNLEQSFVPLKEELREKQPPHLALLFVFLSIFRQLQSGLNEYTRKHLDYFYREILHFKAVEAVPDRANIIFEIQDALKKYLLKSGLKVKGGKDKNKQEILFELNDEIVVNQTKIVDKRTLFVNNRNSFERTFVEGVYMAPSAGMADGVGKEFTDDHKNFPALGSKLSKFIYPGTKLLQPYPDARIGFILASKVFYLQSGSSRKIFIDIPCNLKDNICSGKKIFPGDDTSNCCSDINKPKKQDNSNFVPYPPFNDPSEIFGDVNDALKETYYNISENIIREAVKKGISGKLAELLREEFLTDKLEALCYCPDSRRKLEVVLTKKSFETRINKLKQENKLTVADELIIKELIKESFAFNFLFSGEEEWIDPSSVNKLEMINWSPATGDFTLHVELTLEPESGSVTSYNNEVLMENLATTLPLLKVEMNDKIKLKTSFKGSYSGHHDPGECCIQNPECCLLKPRENSYFSLYHFFRNVTIREVKTPVVSVEVCGLKNFIIQNDESLMDVNSQIYPFGSRPKIDSNFYIGPEEIFLKRWSDIFININWKDKPPDFTSYYDGYQDFFISTGAINVVKEENFRMQLAILSDGSWVPWVHIPDCGNPSPAKSLLFQNFVKPPFCQNNDYQNQFTISRPADFANTLKDSVDYLGLKRLDVNSRNSFIRISLKCQDFQHDKYSFVLARQMAAMGKLPEMVDGAVYYGVVQGPPPKFEVLDIPVLLEELMDTYQLSLAPNLILKLRDLINRINTLSGASPGGQITNQIWNDLFVNIDPVLALPPKNLADPPYPPPAFIHSDFYASLNNIIEWLKTWNDKISLFKATGVVIPNEPWTPVMSGISLDYKASANLHDLDLIHLYPFAGTYKAEVIELQPPLFPTHCDEGTLYLGLKDLVPGNNLNLLFQMAEATSDSESDKETVFWHFLDSNEWKSLRPGFEILDDATNNLTGTGIIKLALPVNMTTDNTIMPPGLHWIKASISKNSGAVSEIIDIHPHVVQVIFTNDEANDKLRLSKPLQAGSISRLEEADASVKSVIQPYETFGGIVPEIEQQFYIRVSESLRHKGRAIQAFDYERLVLQNFPQLFKVKCINHSFGLNAHQYKNDFPYAGGYVLLVVIPDLNKLKAGKSFEPKAPVSLLEEINDFIRQRTSPFVRFRALNPRYEKVDFCLKIKLLQNKDENYYREQIKDDIRIFMAPWAIGDYFKLTFGQCVYRSDIIQYLETRDYIDFIGDLRMSLKPEKPRSDLPKVCPDTPRSILIAGDIEVCIIPQECTRQDLRKPCDTKREEIADYCKRTIKVR
jgi:hypothetical protein